jgi:hypothetical protein
MCSIAPLATWDFLFTNEPNRKEKASRKAAKTQRTRKGYTVKSQLTEVELPQKKIKGLFCGISFLPRPVSIAFYESGTV